MLAGASNSLNASFISTCSKAEKAALRLIARAEQTSFGLAVKLERKGFEAAVVREVIEQLLDRKLLDDERFAELWIRSCLVRKAPSPIWLQASLMKRGIDRDSSLRAIKKVLDYDTEYALLLKYIEKMDVSKNKKQINLKTKLKSEGFSYETLERIFNSK